MALCASTQVPTASATSNAFIGHVGRWLVDGTGRVVFFHGFNMVNKVAPYEPSVVGFGNDDATFLQDHGFNVIRLGVLYSGVEPEPGQFDAAYVSSIRRTVEVLADHHIYTLLDFHQDQLDEAFGGEGFPAWSVDDNGAPTQDIRFPAGYTSSPALNTAYQNFWANTPGPGGISLQQRYADAWKYVAARFANDPWVLGYDLFNEPWPPNVNQGAAETALLASFYKRVISSIRTVDKSHLIFYEPWVLFNFALQTTLPRLGDSNLAMSYHDYCSGPTTAASCPASEVNTITNAIQHAHLAGDGLLLSEFGAETDQSDLTRITSDANTGLQSWIEWAYCGCNDPTGSDPPALEALVYDPSRPPTGTNVNQTKLAVLEQPYATAVAGTPVSMNFDSGSRTFRLRYSTTAVSRRAHFGPSTCTLIAAPRSVYPNGYTVKVAGGTSVSASNAAVIAVTASPKATAVAVTVRPRGSTGVAGSSSLARAPASCA
jgi:endoglycosylceramidase